MKLTINILFVFISLILMSSQCKEDMDCRTKLINNTNETLWFNFDCMNQPDSLTWIGNCLEDKVSANSSKEVCTNDTWESRFSTFETEKVRVYIISEDTAKKYSMPEIVAGEKYYRKDILTQEELNEMNWTITYP